MSSLCLARLEGVQMIRSFLTTVLVILSFQVPALAHDPGNVDSTYELPGQGGVYLVYSSQWAADADVDLPFKALDGHTMARMEMQCHWTLQGRPRHSFMHEFCR